MIIEINTQLSVPIYEQLREQIILGMASKQLLPDEELPSVRRLGADLGINLHTVSKAYSVLCDEGYIIMDRRKGATVAHTVPQDEDFDMKLSHSLKLAAAEATCRGMSEEQFVAMCKEGYQCLRRGEVNE